MGKGGGNGDYELSGESRSFWKVEQGLCDRVIELSRTIGETAEELVSQAIWQFMDREQGDFDI
ncbi:hypothetical protein AGMMS49975_26210 [Clostridia bacterium]|nr:hypothetical protein AGMMS49975_26210 [Clostridia bacterium]